MTYFNAQAGGNPPLAHPFYAGILGGYGSTTWEGLVPAKKNQNSALSMSTPMGVEEGGGIIGVFAGYDILPLLAIELGYRRFPTAKVKFDEDSLFAFEHENGHHFHTHTETVNLMAKLQLVLSNSAVRLYSSAGVVGIHRWDQINDQWRASPSFDLGITYLVNEHWMASIGGNYTAGYGESELDPAKDFLPFLYGIFVSLAYRF